MHRNCFFFFLCFDHLKGKPRCYNRGLELGPVEKKEEEETHRECKRHTKWFTLLHKPN